MVLQRQIVPVDLLGLDEKADPKKVVPGKLVRLENSELRKTGRIDKRTGYDALSSGSITPERLAVRGQDLIAYADDRIYQYDTAGNRWMDRYQYTPCRIKTVDAGGNAGSTYHGSSAYCNGYTLTVFSTAGQYSGHSGIMVTVTRESDGTEVYQSGALFNFIEDVIYAQAVALGTKLYVVWAAGTNLSGVSFDTTAPHSGLSSTVTIATDRSNTNEPIKVVPFDADEMVVGYYDGTNAKLRFFNGSLVSTATLTTAGLGVHAMGTDGNGVLYAIYGSSSTGLRMWVVTAAKATTTTASITTDSGAYGASVRGRTTTGCDFIWHTSRDVLDSSASNTGYDFHEIYIASSTSAGSLASNTRVIYGCNIWSDLFRYNDELYFVALLGSTTQPTYYLCKVDQNGTNTLHVAGVFLPQSGLDTIPHVSASVAVLSSTKVKIPMLRAVRVSDSTLVEAAATSTVEFVPTTALQSVAVGSRTFISGGFLGIYDGYSVTEAGFFHYPDAVWLHQQPISSPAFSANATHSYVAVYEWYDNNGHLHRSEPSVARQVATVSGSVNTIRVMGVAVSNRIFDANSVEGRRPAIRVVLYRTVDNGTTYYRLTTLGGVTGFPQYFEYDDSTSDADIQDNEILYTTGGVVAAQTPPACGNVQVWRNRIWLSDCERQNEVYHSKVKEAEVEFEFNLNNLVKVDEYGSDDCKAVFPLDDKLVMFKGDRLFYLYGDGPDNLGNNPYPEPLEINNGAGLRDPLSLVRMPGGLVFKSSKGFHAIGGDLNPLYLGDAVEDSNDAVCTSALLLRDQNQILFTHSDGSVLCYDYYFKQWSTYSESQCLNAVMWQGKHTMVTTANAVFAANSAVYKDGSAAYNFLMQTGWLSFAGLSGFVRVYKILVEADYKSAHSLTITIDMEQNGTVFSETKTVVGATVTASGSETYRFEVCPSRQKCSSIRIKIEDTLADGSSGTHQALNILSLGFEVGLKRGGPKYKATHSV